MAILAFGLTSCAGTQTDPLEGKTIYLIGDSYAANHERPYQEAWHYKVAARHHMVYKNLGINGNAIAFDRSDRGFGRQLVDRVDEFEPGADYVLVIAGHNDAIIISRGEDETVTFIRSLDTLCKELKAKFPDAKIGFVTPWAVDQPGFRTVCELIRVICADNGIAVLDAAATSGIQVNDPSFRAKYFQSPGDMAHLNAKGHDLLVDWGDEFLKNL